MSFENRIVLVTGAARGIGRACVESFAEAGAKVILNFHTSRHEAEAVAGIFPGRVLALQGDMSDETDIKRFFDEAAKQLGLPEILVNNAGIVNRERFPEVSQKTFLEVLKVNTVGPYLVAREFALRIGFRQGAIINIGSMRAFAPTAIDYSSSKAAVHNLTISLARTLAPSIRVNAVAPGFTDTDMHKGKQDRLEAEAEASILKRYSTPGDIADAVLFLASEKARSITGQVLLVDNGRTLSDGA